MRKIFPILSILLISWSVNCAQDQAEIEKQYAQNFKLLRAHMDTLQVFSDSIVNGSTQDIRMHASYIFIKQLVAALKIPGSFYYPWDSLRTISITYPEDRSYRIFTWQVARDNFTHRFFGAIQMANADKLVLYPLFDQSEFIDIPEDTIVGKDGWYGTIYYNIKTIKHANKTYYHLFGWDGNDILSNKKVVEVLTFDAKGNPVFGAPIFVIDTGRMRIVKTRHIIEFKNNAIARLNYDEDLQMIVFDHLAPQNPLEKGQKFTYIPDGTYEGFKFENGKWYFVEKIFHQTVDEPPIPSPKDLGRDNPDNNFRVRDPEAEKEKVEESQQNKKKKPAKDKVKEKQDSDT